MSDLDKFKKYCNRSIAIQIGEESFDFKPINAEQHAMSQILAKETTRFQDKLIEEIFKKTGKKYIQKEIESFTEEQKELFEKEGEDVILNSTELADLAVKLNKQSIQLFVDILLNSNPGLDKDTAEQFALVNSLYFDEVLSKLIPEKNMDERKSKALEKLKRLQNGTVTQ